MKLKQLFFIAALFVATASLAQQKKGDQILGFNGNFRKPENADGSLNLNFNYGKFVTNNLEGGLLSTITLASGTTTTSLGIYGNYNFLSEGSTWVPYLGIFLTSLHISSDQSDTDLSALAFGGKAGLRKFLSEKSFFDMNLGYENQSFDSGSQSELSINFGFGIIIGKKQ